MGAKDIAKQAGKAALNYAKNYLKNGVKNAVKNVLSALSKNPYFWLAVLIILIIIIVTGMCIEVKAQNLGNTDGMSSANSSSSRYNIGSLEDANFVKNDASDKLWKALKDMNYSDYHAASVLGNIVNESSFDLQNENSSSKAYGLGQWLGTRYTGLVTYAGKKGKPISDLDVQINYLMAEITGKGDAKGKGANQRTAGGDGELRYTNKDWENATTLEDATIIFCWYFETPSTSKTRGTFEENEEKKRIKSAMAYYKAYTGKELPNGSGIVIDFEGAGGDAKPLEGQSPFKFTYTSTITGRIHYIIDQSSVSGWGSYCNRGLRSYNSKWICK